MKHIAFITFIVIILGGCASTNKSHVFSDLTVSTQSELDADISVDLDKKLSGTAKATYLLNIFQLSGDTEFADGYGGMGPVGKAKSAAAYKAISGSDADVLVSPQYVVDFTNNVFIQNVSVTVTGYGGKITSINKRPSNTLNFK
jgi:hypothetical protein|tara:strand:- start:57 stop:488 length:432 start_codon:yes stop_codon:yes gene_type:complete